MKRVDRLPAREDYKCPECLGVISVLDNPPRLHHHHGLSTIKCSRSGVVYGMRRADSLYLTNDGEPISLLRLPKQIMGDCRLILSDWEIMPCNMRIKWRHRYPFDSYGNEVIKCRCIIIKPIAAYTIFV